ncbi:hypothetical protein NK214_11850 [Chromobacterium sp. S0633]|uniref:hypothetical protein n=1 Tax=Chromobacterium sp. S0633 TaxID=2957805 RepID=UPI00209EA9DD|nr:hypothetical protein [Chromobacterium sp. S0633]MCP1290883.1 hypothetical protein [Chromobacterium sp. S0633]
MLYGLTPLGIFHTAVSLLAVAFGAIALWRDGRISPRNRLGQAYVIGTVISCVTALGIFQHGGFGKPHALALITLVVLLLALLAEFKGLFGGKAAHASAVGLSATFLFHWIPAVTETSTRLPLGHPLLSSPDAPALQIATGALLLLFIAGAARQWKTINAALKAGAG